jgi:hypothetical protein
LLAATVFVASIGESVICRRFVVSGLAFTTHEIAAQRKRRVAGAGHSTPLTWHGGIAWQRQ